jgi:predicted AlkP superfamily phosphohydrolase/phosphomutase
VRSKAGQLLAVAATLTVLMTACGVESNDAGRVLLVGIDGANLRVAAPLMEAGRLPNLARIAREGTHGVLRSFLPLYSPRIWNSIATGKTPDKHGIVSFVREDENGETRLLLSSDRKVHALWNIVSDRGLSVGVVNWWNTYPPEVVDGVMISDHFFAEQIAQRRKSFKDPSESLAALTYPESWSTEPASAGPLTGFSDPFAGNNALPRWVRKKGLSRQFRTDGAITRAALEVEAAIRPRLLMVFMPGIDRVSHSLWGSLEPEELYPPPLRPSPAEREATRQALFRYYEYADALIGLLMAGFDENDLVIVVSDHGFEAGQKLMALTGVHDSPAARDGVLFARGPGIAPGSDAGAVTVNDVTPTILTWLGLPVGEDMDGQPAAFLDSPRGARIATYDVGPVERITAASSGMEERIVEELRGLGYLEE